MWMAPYSHEYPSSKKSIPSILFTTHSRVVVFIVVFSFSFSHPEIWQLRKT
jgi:hypothetical protein